MSPQTPDTDLDAVDPVELVRQFAGTDFDFEVLVANPWTPHQVVAEKVRSGRVLLAGDASHQFIPTGGYGMNTGIGDAVDLGWKLAAVLDGWGGDALLDSLEERRKIALRNRDASGQNFVERFQIVGAFLGKLAEHDIEAPDADAVRKELAAEIEGIGNNENESWGIEHGYRYDDSPIIDYGP